MIFDHAGSQKAHVSLALLVAIAGFLLCASAWAQETTGSISGTVKDPSGAVVPNAQVTLRDIEKNTDVRTAKTGDTGDFSFPQLPVAHYSLTVEASGFRRLEQTGIVLNVNDKLTFFPTLEVGAASSGKSGSRSPPGEYAGCRGLRRGDRHAGARAHHEQPGLGTTLNSGAGD